MQQRAKVNSASCSPTWVEWAAVAGVLAYAGLAYTLTVRFLSIFEPHEEAEGEGHVAEPAPAGAS